MKRKLNYLFPLIFVCFLTSCQSLLPKKDPKNSSTKQTSSLLKTQQPRPSAASDFSVGQLQLKENLLGSTKEEEIELNDSDEETTFSDTQNFLGADESLPEEDDIQAIICEDSVYYNSWKEQFDENWRMQNAKRYKSPHKRTQALNKARADAYIQFAHPAIDKIGYDFPPVVNLQVASWIDYFTGKGRRHFIVWLRRGLELIPILENILDTNGLPKDLVYLAMIESGFNNRAVSIDGAVGTWQFMPYTGRQYGLVINDWVDERRDPVKATNAAARYLTDLYAKFGSWHLAAGAYNCGEGCIARKLQKYGSDNSYFDLTAQGVINQQTANYVPKILAAMFIAKNPEKFGFETTKNPNGITKTQILTVGRSISLADLGEKIGVDAKVLGDLNPALRLGITPPAHVLNGQQFEITVPASKYEHALAALEHIKDAPQNRIVQARIKNKETLQKFAQRYKLDVQSLQRENASMKKNSLLKKGQLVNVPVTLGTGQYEKLFSIKRHHTKKKLKRVAQHQGRSKAKLPKNKVVHKKNLVKNKQTTKIIKPKPINKQEAKR